MVLGHFAAESAFAVTLGVAEDPDLRDDGGALEGFVSKGGCISSGGRQHTRRLSWIIGRLLLYETEGESSYRSRWKWFSKR